MSADSSEDVERFVAGLKVVELRDELKKRGVTSYGVKSVLAERLVEAMKAEAKGDGEQEDVQLQEGKEDGERQPVEDDSQLQPCESEREQDAEEAKEPSAHAQEDEEEVEAGELEFK